MPAWIALTASDITAALRAPEVDALRTAALADDQDDPLQGDLDAITARVRAKVASRSGNRLDVDPTLLPPELKLDAVWLVIEALKLRLGDAVPLSEDQRERVRAANRNLDAVARGEFRVSTPDNPEGEPTMQSSGGVASSSPTRVATRSTLSAL